MFGKRLRGNRAPASKISCDGMDLVGGSIATDKTNVSRIGEINGTR